jgi:hypothetical protein
MSDKKPNQKRQKTTVPSQTPEQIAAAKAVREQLEAEAKAEQERVELYGKNVRTMSHRQLRSELKKAVKREHAKEAGRRRPVPVAGLTIAFSTILLAVLDNTRTAADPKLREDQFNPRATSTMNPGW